MHLNTEEGGESVDFLHAEPTVEFMAKVEALGLAAIPVALVGFAAVCLWRYFGA